MNAEAGGFLPIAILLAFVAVGLLLSALVFFLWESMRDRRKRTKEMPASYYRSVAPPLPERRSRSGPPDLKGRGGHG